MIYLQLFWVLLCLVTSVFAQSFNSLSSDDQQTFIQSQQNQSDLSVDETTAAQALLRGRKMGASEPPVVLQLPQPEDSVWLDSANLVPDSILDTIQQDSLWEWGRYANRLFSRVLPTAFFERPAAVTAEYPLKYGDQLVLTLWGTVEREYSLRVNRQGRVNVEGIGLVSLKDLSLGAAESVLKKRLAKVHGGIRDGRIHLNLRLEALAGTKVFVMGDVVQPGGYDLPGNSNVFLALYRAQGPTAIGSVRQIRIIRTNGDSSLVDLYDYLFYGKRSDEAILKDGDVVFIPRAGKLVKMTGDVGRQAIFELKKEEGLREALFFAGGTNATAAHGMELWRVMDDGRLDVMSLDDPKKFLTEQTSFEMLDQDSLVIRVSTKLAKNFVEVSGMVWYPGLYDWSQELNVAQAIEKAGGMRPEALRDRIVIRRPLPDSSYTYLGDSYEHPLTTLQPQDQIIVLDAGVVGIKQPVRIEGAVKDPQMMDWRPELTVKTLISLAGGFTRNHYPGKILVERLVPGKDAVDVLELKIKDDLTLEEGEAYRLRPGDRVVVPVDPLFYEQEVVSLQGAFKNVGSYALMHTRETFKAFMKRVAVLDPNAYLAGGRLFRRRPDSSYYQVNFDMAKAYRGQLDREITLQHGDSIYVPAEQLTVQVKGEVVGAGDVLWNQGWDIGDYLNAAGGFTINGDEDRVVVTYADGRKSTWDRAERAPDPGSVIFVPYKKYEETDWYKVWTTAASVLGTIAQLILAYAVIFK